MIKECEWCGGEFQARRKDSRFCKKDHYTSCKHCGEEILIRQMKRIPVYCSVSCGSKDRSYERACEVCGDSFVAKKSDAKFCTKDHYKKCEVCGSSFVFDPYKLTRTCSKKCAAGVTDFSARNAITAEVLSRKYGVPVVNASQLPSVKEKKKRASQEKYGTDNVSQARVVQDKRKATNLERYGVENAGGAPEVQARIRQTNLERYSVENVRQSTVVKEKIRNTLEERYGVTNSFLLPQARENLVKSGNRRISKLNQMWKNALDALSEDIEFELEVPFGQNCYADLGWKDTLIDINPSVSHNSTKSFLHTVGLCNDDPCDDAQHSPISELHHQDRFLAAEKEGKTLLQYFDWMDEDIFTAIVRSKLYLDENTAPARKCEVRRISQKEANLFLRENHLLGATKGQSFCAGLFFEDELVFVNTYGPARLNKNFEWEAIRSCSKMNWHVQGGLQRADAFFKREASPESIVSYVDLALGGGGAESQNPGWALVATNKPSATWVFVGGAGAIGGKPLFVRDASARRLSADRLLGLEVGGKYPSHHSDGSVFTNSDVLLMEGYLQVFDAGTRTFGWHSPAS